MNIEIEKKYLVDTSLPSFTEFILERVMSNVGTKSVGLNKIVQGYFMLGDNKEVRVRKYTLYKLNEDSESVVNYELCIKVRSENGSRVEVEKVLDEEEGEFMLRNCEFTLQKARTSILGDSFRYDMDWYEKINLMVVEVEIYNDSVTEKDYLLPFMVEDITGNPKYSNIEIAKNDSKF